MGDPGVPPAGWWLASDGRWYPPERAATPAPATPAPQPAGPSTGWFQASDGRWYPSPAPVGGPSGAVPPVAGEPAPGPVDPDALRDPRWPLVVIAVVLVALIAVAVAVLGTSNSSTQGTLDGVPLGPGTATVTWTAQPVDSTTTSYNGTVAGMTLTGTGGVSPTGKAQIEQAVRQPGTALPHELTLYTFTGTLGGTPYTVNLSLATNGHLSLTPSALDDLEVTGTLGDQPITGTLSMANTANSPATIDVTIGTAHVSGTIPQPASGVHTATATFNVTR